MPNSSIIKKIIVWIYNYFKSRMFHNKIRKISSHLKINSKRTPKSEIKIHKKKWSSLKRKINPLWYLVYSKVSGNKDINYIPEDVYYTIVEPCLNNKHLSKVFADKNFFEKHFDPNLFPNAILHNINDIFYDSQYIQLKLDELVFSQLINSFKEIIVKPAIDTGGGKNVDLFSKTQSGSWQNKSKEILNLNFLHERYKGNYIIQEKLKQHSYFSQFNPTSINTVRILTYRSVKNEKIVVLHSLLRIGKPGSHTDNQASGGMSCYINLDGKLNPLAVDKYGNTFLQSNEIRFDKADKVPNFNVMLETAVDIASKELYSRIIGFDFMLDDKNNIRLIEINNLNNEINFYQMNHGPLFKEYTDEIISFCLHNKKTFLIDFEYE